MNFQDLEEFWKNESSTLRLWNSIKCMMIILLLITIIMLFNHPKIKIHICGYININKFKKNYNNTYIINMHQLAKSCS